MMSHEIRTPMNAIIGMSWPPARHVLNAEQRDFAETVRTSGDALLAIINDIWISPRSRPQAGNWKGSPSICANAWNRRWTCCASRPLKRLDLVYQMALDVRRLSSVTSRACGRFWSTFEQRVKFTEQGRWW